MFAARRLDSAKHDLGALSAPTRWLTRPNRSLVLRLTMLVASIVALLVTAMLIAGSFFWREILREQIHERLSAVAESRGDFVREWIARQQDRAEVFAARGVLRGWLERRADGRSDVLQRSLSQGNLDRYVQSGAALIASIADPAGRVLLSSDPTQVGRDVSHDAAFRAGRQAPVVGLPRREGERFTILAAVPVTPMQEKTPTLGVILLTLDATPLATALRTTTGLGNTGDVVLAVRDGANARYLLAPRYRQDDVVVPLEAVSSMAAALEGRSFLGVTQDYRGAKVLAAARPVGYGGWGLVAKMDAREAYAPIAAAGRYAVLLAAAVGIAALFAAFLVARGITRPIRGLVTAAERVAVRDYHAAVPVQRDDELGVLALRFNEMVAALRQSNEQLEARVTERTAKLRETVAELERFSYSLSHDMRAPLRAMEGYAEVVLEEYGDKLGPQARHYLERIIAAAARQDRLIMDVLAYSQVVRGAFRIQPINLDELLADLLHDYPNLRDHAAAIVVEKPLGFVLGHDVLLTQCLSNLLSNALKFMPPGRAPRIVMRTESAGGQVRLWIEDNGIGIAPEHHERIFGMFERMHSQREYEGTGIGLAIVRKAMLRMGGEVGVESTPGAGSRFWLALAAAPRDAHPRPGRAGELPAAPGKQA